ncbi:MAG: hypothetical protein ACRDZZ_13080 [Ilumatobacteraceae bacterium]
MTTVSKLEQEMARHPDIEQLGNSPTIKLTRRTVDTVLIWVGVVVTAVMGVAGGLLTWGSNFADDYVHDELAAQNITFPDAEVLAGQGRDDLVKYAGGLVDSGEEAEAYASYIGGHIEGIAEGQTYAELGGPERAAQAAVNEAIANGAPDAEVAELEQAAGAIVEQRESIFRGEMLRGTLLNTFAWSTIGEIAGIAAIAAFVAAGVMLALVVAGVFHLRRARA